MLPRPRLRCAARRPSRRRSRAARPPVAISRRRPAAARRGRRRRPRRHAGRSPLAASRAQDHDGTVGMLGGELADEPQRLLGFRLAGHQHRVGRGGRRGRSSSDRGPRRPPSPRVPGVPVSRSRTRASSTPASSATSVEIVLVIDIIAHRPRAPGVPGRADPTGWDRRPSSSRSRFVSDGLFWVAPAWGRSAIQSLPLSEANARLDAPACRSRVSTTFCDWLCWASRLGLRAGRRSGEHLDVLEEHPQHRPRPAAPSGCTWKPANTSTWSPAWTWPIMPCAASSGTVTARWSSRAWTRTGSFGLVKSAMVSCCPGTMFCAATFPRRLAGSVIAPSLT